MGSEMCIRDRVIKVASIEDHRILQSGLDRIEVRASELLPLGYDCLLYTSDAADERSSVDLGGRRIIKKKNTVNVVGGRGTRHIKHIKHRLPIEIDE